MANTPVTWRNQFIANTTTTGSQSDPDIIQLANGNILVSWTSDDNTGAGSSAGLDVIGQIFDPVGNEVGGEFRVNVFGNASDESDMDMAPTADGGFLAVYERVNGGITTICIDRYNSSGVQTGGNFIVNDGDNLDPNFSNPRIAVSSATSALVVYEQTEASGTVIVGKIYDPSTNTVSSQFDVIAFSGGDSDADATALTNGNYVITATHANSGDARIIYRVVNSSGSNVVGVTEVTGTGGNADNDREATVTALTGGGFVIAWTNTDANDTDILFRVYNAAGTEVGSGSPGDGGATNDNNEPVVVALADGRFIVAYDNDETGFTTAAHYDATGTFLGTFDFASSATNISAASLADGRVAITWQDQSSTEIQMEILDTRDTPNNPEVYSPDGWVIGTSGDDVFTAAFGAEFIHGGSGNDTITESGGTRSYNGSVGNDRLKVVSSINEDTHDGGSGTDIIDWTGCAEVGATFNLQTGKATNAAGTETENMLRFESLGGTQNADNIIGSTVKNRIGGNGGNDTVNAFGGNDDMFGGNGNDRLNGGTGNDLAEGGAGNDTVTGGAGKDTMTGNTGKDVFDFNAISDSGTTAMTRDIITDFDPGSAGTIIDRIDLSTIDAIPGGANNPFTFVNGAFTGIGQVNVVQSGTDAIVRINTAAAAGAEMTIQLNDVFASGMNGGDFIL